MSDQYEKTIEPPGIRLGDLAAGRTRSEVISARPYWWRAAPPRATSTFPPQSTDVLIVGAGYTGLSAALVLARAGRQVTVVDAGVPGFGASTRNGGQVGSGNQKFRVKTLIAMQGERKAVELLHEGVAMLDGIEALVRDEQIDCSFRRCGRFRGAMRPEHYDAMARDMEDLARYAGVTFEMVERRNQHTEIATDMFHGGSLLPQDAALHPGRYHAGLMARAIAAGATVFGNSPVGAIARERDGHNVQIGNRTIRARDVLIATNGYTKNVSPYFDQRIVPVGSAQIATEIMPPEVFDRLMPGGRVYGCTNRVFFYFRPAPDERRLIWGGRVDHFKPETAMAAYAHLARDLLRAFPMLGDVRVTDAWSGLIGHSFDDFPHLGRAPDGVYYAMGYCGTGVSRSTHFGRKIALKMLGHADGRSAFDDLAFPSHPFHAFARPAVPLVESWYRARDFTGL
ncbi:FAD-binding oxidoreductase [Rhodopseudomonas sp. B29]|uniref:NAD(P)/FAD-dependent oxidoreductase n=1 Tax=Rhodopseudomonas sp. B29 TaxID=95607 RepID=UPI0003B34D4B|nr:FAD-binding oxidoreductase [Rhodopseudomonas sp. B29]